MLGRVQEHLTGGNKGGKEAELSLQEEDVVGLERDLHQMQGAFRGRNDVLVKVRLLIRDNLRLRECLAERNKISNSNLDSLLLAQILELERDNLKTSGGPGRNPENELQLKFNKGKMW